MKQVGFRSFGAWFNELFTFLGSTTDRLQSRITLILMIILDENHLFNFIWLSELWIRITEISEQLSGITIQDTQCLK